MSFAKSDPEIEVQLQLLKDATVDFQRGDILEWTKVEELLELPRDNTRLRYVVNKWRNHLLRERKIECWPETAVGIKLQTVDEQLNKLPAKRSQRAARQNFKTVKGLTALKHEDMSEHQLIKRAAMIRLAQEARSHDRRVSAATKVDDYGHEAMLKRALTEK
jgi:hypothetical protein